MGKKVENYLIKLKGSSKAVFSIGLGGFLALYFIQLCRVKLLPLIEKQGEWHEFTNSLGETNISMFEISILLASITAMISAPLLSEQDKKRSKQVFLLVIMLFFNVITFISVLIHQQITAIFIISITLLSVYLVWILLEILKIIHNWTKEDKDADGHPDVTKLTFIWAVIAFVLGIMI